VQAATPVSQRGTYRKERVVAEHAPGCGRRRAWAAVRRAESYFMGRLGLTYDSPTRIPDQRFAY
jgi:hypothetical protein